MLLQYAKRLFRGGCLLKLVYLSFLSTAFVLLTYQLKSGQSYAKPIQANVHDLEEAGGVMVDEPHDSEKGIHQADPLPIIKNEDGDGVDPARVDSPVVAMPEPRRPRPQSKDNAGLVYINNEKYPKLSPSGKFIPLRRIVQLDLKGAPYKVEFFTELFYYLKRIKATGIVLEWEDMFPYTGKLSAAVNNNAYTMEDVQTILTEAQRHHLEVIPLVQTFGHLEWILKLEPFAHLREDPQFPQVICFPEAEAWELIKDMIDQVARVHQKYDMPFFHMGADEVFQLGVCNASISEMDRQGSRERLMLWHMSRTATYIKTNYKTTVLAWHDMFANVMESDLYHYNMTEILEPVLWSYAEDLDMYLPRSTWMSLMPFRRVWGSSAWKGADGPARYNSNPIHYIKNHESWTNQFTYVYKDFEVVQGLLMTGWSRYDHLAVLAELMPVAIPSLTMCMETVLEARPLNGEYAMTKDVMDCTPPTSMGYVTGCQFPGRKVYELVNEYWRRHQDLQDYRDKDYELNGWMSRLADSYQFSSQWYINKVEPMIRYHFDRINSVERSLRTELSKIYFQDAVDEFVFTYLGEDLEWLEKKIKTADKIGRMRVFQKRPFVKYSISRP